MELKNRWIHFRIQDVYIPEPEKLLVQLYGDDLLQGKVLDVSDSGLPGGAFVVVQVEGIDQQLIVPVERILGAL